MRIRDHGFLLANPPSVQDGADAEDVIAHVESPPEFAFDEGDGILQDGDSGPMRFEVQSFEGIGAFGHSIPEPFQRIPALRAQRADGKLAGLPDRPQQRPRSIHRNGHCRWIEAGLLNEGDQDCRPLAVVLGRDDEDAAWDEREARAYAVAIQT